MIFTKVSGVWKRTHFVSTKVSGVWKDIPSGYSKVSGVWKTIFTSICSCNSRVSCNSHWWEGGCSCNNRVASCNTVSVSGSGHHCSGVVWDCPCQSRTARGCSPRYDCPCQSRGA